MGIVIDIIVLAFLILGTYAGWKRGLIKSLVNVIGLVAIVIISYALKGYIVNILIDNLPFFSLPGLEGLTSINVLLYNLISFIVIFIVLYCLLNIIIAITGFIDTLLKFTVIWIIPSKIGGAIIGLVESWVFVYLALFMISFFSVTSGFVLESRVSSFVLNHTPVVGKLLGGAKDTILDVSKALKDYDPKNDEDVRNMNLNIMEIEVKYGLLTAEKAQELMDTGKVEIDNVYIVPIVKG